jgi:histidinol-phosphate aminotransferase
MDTMSVKIPNYISSLVPYRAGKPIAELAREKNLTKIVKLASNENPLGPSPKAQEAVVRSLHDGHRYPDPSGYELLQVVAKKFGKQPSQIVAGAGTDALLAYIINAFSNQGEEVLTSVGTFIGIYVSTNKLGRSLVQVPLKNYGFDLAALEKAITPKTKIIFIANPNNPTGTMITKKEWESFIQRVPQDILVILDEAYFEYAVDNADYPNGLEYSLPNLIVTRTLSKSYGLAGLRIGFAFGPEALIREVSKVKMPFEPSIPASAACIAAFDDEAFLQQTLELNRRNLAKMKKKFKQLKLQIVETAANFYLLVFKDQQEAATFTARCIKVRCNSF